jgi:uncharacterized membrane protein
MKVGLGRCVIQFRLPESCPNASIVFNLYSQTLLGLFGLLGIDLSNSAALIEWSLKLYIRPFTLFA